jgi:hypothetical protein
MVAQDCLQRLFKPWLEQKITKMTTSRIPAVAMTV